MRHNPSHAIDDEGVLRRLIAENPWATFVSHNEDGLVASQRPVILETAPPAATLGSPVRGR